MTDEPEYGLVMPFVAVESNGGQYNDSAYIAGYELGMLEGQLSGPGAPSVEKPGPPAAEDWRWIRQGNAAQIDLLAMRHGKRVEFGDTWEDLIAARVVGGDGE